MAYAQWDPALETGDPLVDAEHHAIYDLVNEMFAHIEAGEEREIVEASMSRILDYAQVHFVHEEALMARTGYPDIEHHRVIHREFSAEAERLAIEKLAGVSFSPLGLTEFMRNWLDNHLEIEDRRLGEFLRETDQLSSPS